jgi:O-antigen/teichoic acid export membrane protein
VTAGEHVERRADFFISASWVLNTIAVCALVPLIPLSDSIISLWINPQAAEGAASILRVLAAAGVIGSAVNVYLFHSMGTGENARLAALYVINAIITTGFTVLLIGLYGPRAAGFGILLASVIQLGMVIYLSRKTFSGVFTSAKLVHCTLSPLWSGLVLAWFWYHNAFFSPSGWMSLALVFMLISFSALLGSVAVTAATREGRTMLVRVYRIAKRGLLKKR